MKTRIVLPHGTISKKAYTVFLQYGFYFFVDESGYYYLSESEDGSRPASFSCMSDVNTFLEDLIEEHSEPKYVTIQLERGGEVITLRI